MDMELAKQLFTEEALDLLNVMESSLLGIESGETTVEQEIDAIFRAAHTIKGSAGLFGFDAIVGFTHSVESVLEQVRAGSITLDAPLCELLLDCHKQMSTMIDVISGGPDCVDIEMGARLITALNDYLAPKATILPPPEEPAIPALNDAWGIQIAYGIDVFRDGMDPASQISYLCKLGSLEAITPKFHWPEDFDPESCYLNLSLVLVTDANKQTIEDVFEFIHESSEIHIQAPLKITEQIKAIPQQIDKLGEVLLEAGAVTKRELNQALEQQKTQHDKAVGELLVAQGVVHSSVVEEAVNRQAHQEHRRPSDYQVLKVEARKLDQLIKLIGELVTSGATNEMLIQQVNNEELTEAFSSISSLIEQIRDSALSLRMVQIGESFSRLKRIVRDVSRELNKEVELVIKGAETELDKSMVEKLSDPLMHLIRNALDHGIEPVDIRSYRGKPAAGLLQLNAYHEAGAVVIEIKDDGAGLDPDKIHQKAVDKGLITADTSLSKEDIFKLIFSAGFSTAAQVTNLSGRGVGMDVVKRNIEELRGQILIDSELGKGTCFKIRLPLTLAIIDGFEVSVGNNHFVLPVNMIYECIEFNQAELVKDRDYLNLRGEVLPFVRLSQLFNIRSAKNARENIVVVQYGENKSGLVVDTLHGELQAVIKPLAPIFKVNNGFTGSTILGSGDIGFILDIPQLIDFACSTELRNSQITKTEG